VFFDRTFWNLCRTTNLLKSDFIFDENFRKTNVNLASYFVLRHFFALMARIICLIYKEL